MTTPQPSLNTPFTIERLKSCLDNFKTESSRGNGNPRVARERLAAIAQRVNPAYREPWVGPVLALLSESFEATIINKIMVERPGKLHAEVWQKWDLAKAKYEWDKTPRKDGTDKIRNLVYDLLMEDLRLLYSGYTDSKGNTVSRLSIDEVCKKVREEIGFTVIKGSHLREQLKTAGVPIFNLKGEPVYHNGRGPLSAASPSTVGPPTPVSDNQSTSYIPTARRPTSAPRTLSHPPVSNRRVSALPTANSFPGASRPQPTLHEPIPQSAVQRPKTFPSQALEDFNMTLNQQPNTPSELDYNNSASQDKGFLISHAIGNDNVLTDGPYNMHIAANSPSDLVPGLTQSGRQSTGSDISMALRGVSPSVEEHLDRTEVVVRNWEARNGAVSRQESHAGDNLLQLSLRSEQPCDITSESQMTDIVRHLFQKMNVMQQDQEKERIARKREADELKADFLKRYEDLSIDFQNSTDEWISKSRSLTADCERLEKERKQEQERNRQLSADLEKLTTQYYHHDEIVQRMKNANGEQHSKMIEMRNRLDMVESQNIQLKAMNASMHANVNSLKRQSEADQMNIAALQRENQVLRQGLETTKEELETTKASLKQEVSLLKKENDTLRQENQNLKNRLSNIHVPRPRFSTATVDSAVGDMSPRDSIASTRKRQISITDERDEKRARASDISFGTFFNDDEDFSSMHSGGLAIRGSGNNSPATWV